MKDLKIKEIEALKEDEVKSEALDVWDIKGHTVYIVEFEGAFGLSALVFKNGHHIKYANDYQLHYHGETKQHLVEKYEAKLNRILFTEEEILSDITGYKDYKAKMEYIINYLPLQYDVMSGYEYNPSPEYIAKYKALKHHLWPTGYGTNDDELWNKFVKVYRHLESEYKKCFINLDYFREMMKYELANHEAGYTGEYEETLFSLGIKEDSLSPEQLGIINSELWKQIEYAC